MAAIAVLPMYDLPEIAGATDSWWSGLARALRREGVGEVPDRLTRHGDPLGHWSSAGLLLGQTCGYPLTHALAGRATLVATPCYAAPGCCGASYDSVVVVCADSAATRFDQLRGTTCAVNGRDSQSGYNALRALAAPLSRGGRFFGRVVTSGSHRASLELLASGRADVAAIDCVTHALLARHAPAALDGTRVLCRSASAPGLPYVTAAGAGADLVDRLRAGLRRALEDPDLASAREDLLLVGFEPLPLSDYGCITAMEAAAVVQGYPEIA